MRVELKQSFTYKEFTFYEKNRPIEQSNLTRIKASMRECNLTMLDPLVCTMNKEILDGQHRFIAARDLKMPFWYIYTGVEPEKVIRLLNCAQEKWKTRNYLDFYKKDESIVFLMEMQEVFEIRLDTLMGICCAATSQVGDNGRRIRLTVSERFHKGLEFRFLPELIREQCVYNFELVNSFDMSANKKKKYRGGSFLRGMWPLYLAPFVDTDHLFARIVSKVEKIPTTGRAEDYRKWMVYVYNKKLITKKRLILDDKFNLVEVK